MENSAILIEMGLSKAESEAYLALLKLGGGTATKTAHEIGVKRTTAYPILESLAKKGFASVYFRKTKRFYYALRPHKVASLFEKKLDIFNSMIPMLEMMGKKETQTKGLRFIETKEELKQFYLEILTEYEHYKTKEYYAIGSTQDWEEIDSEFFTTYRKNRAKIGIKTKLLLSSESKKINPTEDNLLREFKYLPEKYKFRSTIDIYKDKILIVSPDLSSLAVVIAIPAMVDIFKSIFEIIWDTTN
jgi:sugar-specific transcriptional regulator TrmB